MVKTDNRKRNLSAEAAGAFLFISPVPEIITGLSVYTDNFVSSYADLRPDLTIILHTNAKEELFPLCTVRENIYIKHLRLPKGIPFKLAAIAFSLWLSFHSRRFCFVSSTTPLGSFLPVSKSSVTIHDVYDIDIKYRSLVNVIFFRMIFSLYRLTKTRVFCVSETTARGCNGLLHRNQISVLLEASRFPIVSHEEASLPRRRGTFLYIANVQNTKNFPCFLEIARLAYRADEDWTFIWVGVDEKGIVSKLIGSGPLPSNIQALGQISEDELKRLYKQCDALLVTSWEEGFCLPVVEAQASGMPVIVSDIPIMQEIAGQYAYFFNPQSAKDGYLQIKRYLSSQLQEDVVRHKAIENARRFSWVRSSELFDEWVR